MQRILPMPVITGAAKYPEDIPETVKKYFHDVVFVDALSLAVRAGSARAVNVVLLGVMAKEMDIGEPVWMDVIRDTVKPAFKDINEKAFLLGKKEVI
jgi:indolepyruvate ferredoxin oxidoreductase beta subunit